jgi:hypothetical protein
MMKICITTSFGKEVKPRGPIFYICDISEWHVRESFTCDKEMSEVKVKCCLLLDVTGVT